MGLATLIGAEELPRALDELCMAGPWIRAVTRDPSWLASHLSRPGCGSIHLDLISSRRPRLPPAGEWHWSRIPELPPPEYLLFSPTNSGFPSSALVLTHTPEPGAWAALYTRPLVLDTLLRRFRELKSQAIDARTAAPRQPPTAPAVREAEGRSPSPSIRQPDPHHDSGPPARGVPPATLYARILASHFGPRMAPGDTEPSNLDLAPHQERAYERARDMLERYGGVLIADAVGLGKTYIALRLIEDTLDGRGALVVVPAALRRDWQDSVSRLRSPSRRRKGSPPADPSENDNLDLWVREPGGRCITGARITSTESLGQQTFDPGQFQQELVVVDEAHRFRNPLTRRYRNLSELARRTRVVLLTATPINNSITDLEALLSLFAEPGAFRHLGIHDYREALRAADPTDRRVRAIVSACVVRRTRQFLRRHYGDIRIPLPGTGKAEPMRFPERRPPVAVRYDLRHVYGRGMPELESWLESLTFPQPPTETGTSLQDTFHAAPGLLQVVLLKRLESSLEAFRRTVIQQLAWCRTALDALDAGRVLTRPEYRSSFRGPTDDPGSQLALVQLMLTPPDVSARALRPYRERLESDLRQFERMHRSLRHRSAHRDEKFQRLAELLEGRLAGRKILLFTEFRDTAHYLYRALSDRPHLGLIHSGHALLGRQSASRREVIERFAPFSNGRPEPSEIERVDLLIATDVASEGLNLQDASIVISYDLPWNPVRLMQRMGRIDRLGSRHEYVELYHFVPDADLDRLLGLMDRLQTKIRTIAATMGLDSRILGTDDRDPDTRQALRRLVGGTSDWHEIDVRVEGPVDPEEQAYLDFRRLPQSARPGPGKPPVVSVGTAKRAGGVRAAAYWVIATEPARRLWLIQTMTGEVREDPATAVEILRSARPAGSSPAAARIARARHAFTAYVESECRRLAALTIAGERLPSHLPQYRLAAWLTRSLASEAVRAPLQTSTDVDRILDRLGRRFLPADERLLQRLLDERPERPDADFLAQLESVLARMTRRKAPGLSAGRLEVGTLVLTDHSST